MEYKFFKGFVVGLDEWPMADVYVHCYPLI